MIEVANGANHDKPHPSQRMLQGDHTSHKPAPRLRALPWEKGAVCILTNTPKDDAYTLGHPLVAETNHESIRTLPEGHTLTVSGGYDIAN